MVIRLLKRIFCKHNLVWDRNIHGDEINSMNGQRSWWKCEKCDNFFTKSKLITKVEAVTAINTSATGLLKIVRLDDTMNQYDMICDSIEKLSRYDYDDDGIITMCKEFMDGKHEHTVLDIKSHNSKWIPYPTCNQHEYTVLDIKSHNSKWIPYPTCNQHEYTNACYELLYLCRMLIRDTFDITTAKDTYDLILFYIKEIEKTEPYLNKNKEK